MNLKTRFLIVMSITTSWSAITAAWLGSWWPEYGIPLGIGLGGAILIGTFIRPNNN